LIYGKRGVAKATAPWELCTPNYSSTGAPTGHKSAQLPQEMHSSALITNLPSPSEMQEAGHSAAHAPQEMHSSVILKAIVNSSVKKLLAGKLIPYIYCITTSQKIKSLFQKSQNNV